MNAPRILVAGTASGCGKTTASMLLMACLRRRGLSVAPFKAGPDYIDPGFHRRISGRACHNLDTRLMRRGTILRLLHPAADIAVIEGVMGYCDGTDIRTLEGSTWELGRLTGTPALLVADASGGAVGAAAAVMGYRSLPPGGDSGIAGVLVNRVSGPKHYERVREAVETYAEVPCLGCLPKREELELPSRHLGLVTARETPDLLSRVGKAADEAEKTLDLPGILALAGTAAELPDAPPQEMPDLRGFRLGVALDEAFHFYYAANLDALESCGAELSFFSPLRDPALPPELDGLYIGGGYPEVYARELEANVSMRESIRRALCRGLRCYAECGGLLYLSRSLDGRGMCGFLPIACRMTDRLQRFGYVTVTDRTGLAFPAHEFHRAVAEPEEEIPTAYAVRKMKGNGETWRCGYEKENTLAAFVHVHFADRPELIRRFWL